ncbi:ABC transporter permease [Planococcus sp. NCCP-2050]|uniref:ABC transporter permease n=1 Tax=Planococcus sp. NCCP-2050 TaxID=2944679 RepID=UPI00203BEC8C|nr:ABC transporter permease [Planococcus sp. NCCP-2050]
MKTDTSKRAVRPKELWREIIMIAIGKREFISMFKSVKSIIIIAILLLTSYYSAKFSGLLASGIALTEKEMADIHTVGLLILLFIFGQLFVMGLSHDSINKESHERTMRFLVTRTSRLQILLGKFAGAWLFWFTCLVISFLVIAIFALKFDFFIFSQVMALLTFQIALTILLSVAIPKPSATMFLGIVIGLLFPALGAWLVFTDNPWFSWLKFASPYYYLMEDTYQFLIIFGLAGLLLAAAALIFNRREF